MARMVDIPMRHRDVWNPSTCPIDVLPWLAWALSIDAWRSTWPEHIKRARVRNAIDIQRRKGTADSVRSVIAAFGGAVQLREWWQQSPPGIPHTFEMVLTIQGTDGQAATAQYVDDVIAEVQRTKPVRSHFDFTQGLQAGGVLSIGGAARVALYRRFYLQPTLHTELP